MFGKKCNDNGEKLYRYSIRKYHFGAASVAVAALMFFANGAVKADTLPVSPVTANTEKVNAGVTGLTEGVPPKENLIEKSKEVESDKTPAAQKQVDKSPLVQAISELQAAIAKVDEESLLSLSNQLSQLTDENKRLLDGENISKEVLTNQVNRVQSLTEQVRQLESKSKTEDKTSNKEDRADSKAQNTKELKVSDKAVTPTNQAEEIKAVQKDENKGEDTANKDKLEALSKSLITYLDTAKKIERPETKKLLEGVEEIVRSVENGLANPKLSASEIEELMKQGKQAEKKLVLAVTRENSGKRDTRNGNKMLPESYFRALNTREGANTEFGNAYIAWMITNDDVRRFQSAGINDPNYRGYNYPVGTFLYNSNNAENSPINNNNMQGPQRIAWTRNRVYVQVNRVSGNEQTGYEFNWKIQFNAGREPHQKPFYYFTLPDGHDFSNSVVLKENESQIATGTIDDVLQKSQGLLNGKMGTTEGVNGGEYYKGTGLINGHPYIQAPIRTLEDFVKNSTNYYFNRSGVNGDIIQKSDFLFENIRNSTKNIIAIQPQGRNPGGFNHSYSFEFTTHSNSGDAPYYVAGVKTYETTLGLTQHRSYSQWGTLKDAYTIKTDSFTNGDFKKKTFLKGTQLGTFENSSYSFNSDAVSTVMGDRFIDAGLVLRNNTTGQDERPRKGGLLLKITPTATIDGSKYSHIHNFYNYNNPNDALTNSKDRTKGGHLAYLEGTYNGSTIKIPFSFNIVTQSDIFEPIKNEAKENQARKTTDNLGNATDFISGYNNISSRIPDLFTNWNEGNSDTFRNIFKGNSDRFPGSSNDIKSRAIKNVEWADGNSNLTGEKIVPVKVRYTPQGAAAYEETKYVTLPRELNNLSIGQVLTEAQKQKIIELAKSTFDVDSASFDGNTAKVGVKKQVKITYMDNEKNALTGNKDDSVRYVDFHFTNLTVPDSNKPVVTMNGRRLTTNENENQFIIYRGAAFNPTFQVTDESKIGSLMVTNLPKGVYFNKVDNVDTARVGTTTVLNHTISNADSNKVADDATLGEHIASVEASDQYGNRETYKFKYRVVDIQAKNSTTENRAVGSELGNSRNYFKVAESNTVNNDKYYPENIQFKWNEFDSRNGTFTNVTDNTKLNELGTINKYIATAVFSSTVNTKSIGGVNYTIYTPTKKAVPMTFNVTDTVAPTVKMTNPNNTDYTLGGSENGVPEIEVFGGATLNIPLKMFDNNTTGKINIKHISGLPAGVTLKDGNTVINNGNTLSKNSGSETNPATATITGTVAPNATLGTNTVILKVSDDATRSVDKGNQATLKFKVKTYDLAFEDRGTRVDDNTRSDVLGLNTQSLDPNYYLAITDGRNVTNDWGSGMVFRYLKENNEIRERVSFDKIGKHSVKARAYFPTNKTSTQGLPTNSNGLTGDTAATAGRGYLEKTIEFNVKPNAPTISQPQFYGTASSKPTVTVGNLPTNAQLQNGATVTVELYQGTTKVASKTVTDGNATTTLSAENFTANLTEGQQVHAVVKVSVGQGTTAYSVNSDNSENRNVTGRSRLSNLATDKLVVQVQDLANNRRGTLSNDEKQAIKQAIFEANKNGVLRGKQVSDINISDTGLITALDKDNKIAELQINPNTGVVTRFAHIRDDYNITYTNNGKPANRSTDPGFEWSQDRKSLIYKFDATSGVGLDVNEVLKTITATPKNTQGQPSLTTVTGNDKALGEANSNGFSRNASTGYFSKNGVGVNVLDLVNPTNYRGGGNVSNTGNKLVDINHGDVNGSNIIGTNLETGTTTITGANGSNSITLNNVVKGRSGNSLIEHKQLYLMPKYTDATLLTDRGTTATGNTNVINVYFVPIDPRKPEVSRPATSSLAATKEAITNAQNVATGPNGKISANFLTSKVDVRDNYDSPAQAKAKLEMYVQKDGETTRTKVVTDNNEDTDAISTIVRNAEQGNGTSYYKVIAKTTDRSGNVSDEAVVGWFKVEEKGKPTVKLVQNNQDTILSDSTPETSVPKVTVYRGEKAEITVKASDNTGKVQNLTITNLPTGLTPDNSNQASDTATDATPLTKTTTGKVDKTATVEVKVATVTVSDKSNPANTTTVQFKVDVKEQKDKYTPTAGTTVKVGNIGTITQPDEDKIKNAVTVPALSEEATRDGVTKKLKDHGRVTAKNGKNYVTVEVVYPDGSKDEVDVAVDEVLKAGEKNPTNKAIEGQPYTSNEKVINPNKPDTTVTPTPTKGLTIDNEGKVTGTPTDLTWTGDETEQTVTIPVEVKRGEEKVTVNIPVVVQRDLDKDGTPDATDPDIDGDGILNDDDKAPRQKDGLTAGEKNPTNKAIEGQPYTSNEKVINPNKPDTTVTPTPTKGLTIDNEGKVTGTPTDLTWTGDETEQTVTIPVEVKRGEEKVTVNIPVVVQRDLDKDGTPDATDPDIDGDGILNDDDKAPRQKDGLTAGEKNPTNKAIEGQPYTSNEKVINPNKPDTTVTPTPTKGLTIDNEGKVTGTPTDLTWTGDETEQTVTIPVEVKRGEEKVTVNIPVVVQRDLDKDGTPDATDPDIDGDGILNDDDKAPRQKDGLTAGEKNPTNKAIEGQPYTSNEKVINPNKPDTTVTPTPTKGLTIDNEGKVTGTPTDLTWTGDETEQTVTIPVEVKRGEEKVTVNIPVVVQRDLDKDGTPDATDPDIDGDGILNDDDKAPRQKDGLTAGEKNPTNKAIEGQPYTSNEKVINPNKPDTTVTPTPTKGLTIDNEGKVTGTPTDLTWTGDETEQTVTIPVEVKRGEEKVTVNIPVVVQRDLDKDGTPDATDPDIDGDGILNDDDKAPRQKDGLTAGEKNPTNKAIEGQPYTSNEKVINPNKPDTTVTPTPTKGLTIDNEGKVTGTPTDLTWTGDETEQTVTIPVEVKRGEEKVTVNIPVVVQRDLDKDGTPDATDPDIDGDGILNDDDKAPRQKDGLTAGEKNPTNKAIEGQPYTSNEKVINPNKPDTTVTPTPTKGLTIDNEGKVTGTPTDLTWTGDETEQTVTIPVEVKRGEEKVTVNIPVVVQRDLDKDGTPDATDPDIDGDGILNDDDKAPRQKDGLTAGEKNPTNKAIEGQPYTSNEKVINPNKPDTTVTPTPTKGLTIDNEGKVTGTPTDLTWTGDETEQTVTIPVEVKRGEEKVTVNIPVVVQRDLDKDGTPDATDPDIDGDGILNDDDKAPRQKDGLTAGEKNPTNKAIEGQPYTSNEKVINPNKPDTAVTPTPTKGLTIDNEGKVTGTPTDLTWTGDETEQTVTIPVEVKRGEEKVTVNIPVVVQRDLDKDGTPDATDPDIDGDGILNDDDKAPRQKDGLTAGEKNPTNKAIEGQPYTSNEKVINPNKPDTTVTPTPTKGLTIDNEGKVTGTPTDLTWTGDETEQTVTIPVEVKRGEEKVTVNIPVVVQRDLDKDGTPDATDPDIDGDGILNDDDKAPRQKDGLTAGEKNPTNKAIEGQPYTSNEKVINPNKPDTTVTPTPTKGLTIDNEGKVTGTPTDLTWTGDETEQTVTIPVEVKRGEEKVTVNIPVVVQRDLDKDGTPDATDPDIDGDGILNDDDKAPRQKDGLTAGEKNPTNKAIEGQPYTSNEKVINPNKPDTTVTPTPTKGLTIDNEGKVTGTPTDLTWTGDETEQTVTIPVEVKRGEEKVTVNIPVVVQRDLDKDGTPDATDPDIDGDGILNDDDKAPRQKDGLTAGEKNPTNKAIEGQPYTSNEKVINPNKPDTTVTPTPTKGLTIDNEGKVTGTPTDLTWTGDETEQTVTIPVEVKRGEEKVTVNIPVVVQRDLDKDGTPDATDPDIDGDGILNDDDKAPRQKDGLTAGEKNPTNKAIEGQPYTSNEKVINPNKPDTTVTPTPTKGLTIDNEGKVTGTPTDLTWTGDETEQTVTIPVEVKRGEEKVTVNIPVVVQRDLDKDGTPDATDPDIDGDGILNDDDKAPRQKDGLTAGEKNPTNKAIEGQPYTSNEKVINPNKPDTTVTPTPTKGLTIDNEGKVTGTPTDLTWTGDETEQTVTIPVEVKRGEEKVTVNIPVVVQRDLDKDGTPDATDPDIDGDGILNDDDKAPRQKDGLTAGEKNPTNKAIEGQPYTSNEKVINPNKPDTTVTPTPTKGLTIDNEGKVTGTPTDLTWTGDETEQTVTIPVEVKRGEEKVTVNIPVVVQRDLDKDGTPEKQQSIPEYTEPIGTSGVDENGNLLEPPVVDILEYTEPIGTSGVDENGNLLDPPVVDIPEYTSPIGTTGVDENGNLIEPPIKHQTKLIITKWVDEKGNELKPADAKAPKVLGEANEAFEHGEIEGYVFVRTETKGDVVTHVFRKVSQVRPTGDGQQRPATPSDVTNSRQNTANPAEVPATQPTEQPSQTVEVPAQLPHEVSETDSSVSQPQAVLPNTGTQEDRATGALGFLSLLGTFGLLFAKKKKDDEEEA